MLKAPCSSPICAGCICPTCQGCLVGMPHSAGECIHCAMAAGRLDWQGRYTYRDAKQELAGNGRA